MKLLIIGASGFIGNYLYNKAVKENIQVTGTAYKRVENGFIYFNMLDNNFKDILPPQYKSDPEVLGVICSANPMIEDCKRHLNESHQLNVISTKKLIDDLAASGIKFCFLSSDNVYDGTKGYYDETEIQCPCNEYGKQKAEIENYILKNYNNNLIFRLSQTLSNTCHGKHLFAEWNRWCRTKQEIVCIKDNIFSPTFVDDIYEALKLAYNKNISGLYNCVNGEHFRRDELAWQFVRHLYPDAGVKIISKEPAEFGFTDGRALKTYLDNTKIVKEIGIKFTSMKTLLLNFNIER